ncbi:hypothetical protein EGT67_22060 [Prescottella agglutinans]|uniref:Uncharacterized protein n=1 Tax=Prescottella agglutinans TaxID=1644129 RepID=A0A3S3ACU4_9NOCA|nr:hypothetical protein [Prescottella agglutinans]RVW07248.1 hypothetical protein EGT67_22060 [Prescottella agglutinans]
MTDPDASLWQALGLSVDDALDQVPDDVWASAVRHAVDPSTPEVDTALVPEMDDSTPDEFDGDDDLTSLLDDDPSVHHDGHDTDHHGGLDDDAFISGCPDDGDGIDLDDGGI